MSKVYKFFNCRVMRNGALVKDDLWVRDGKIVDPREVFWFEKTEPDVLLDCTGMIIAPGFIDVQLNGGFGVDFSTPSDDIHSGLMKVAKGVLKHGCTSFCPTIITSETEMYQKIVPKIKRTPGGEHGASILGLHLEGPFINPLKKGAHKEALIKNLENFTIKDIEQFYGSLNDVSIITLAPEKAGDMKIIRKIVKRKVVVSVGHTTADIAQGEQAARNGATFITHLFNAMLPFHHRDPGVVGLLTSDDIPTPIFYGLIADGIHTHPSATRIAYRSHPEGLVLVTDAIIALGLKPGIHQFGPVTIEKKGEEKATIAGTETLAGSVASMDFCVRKFKEMSGCSVVEALECATLHPAQLLNIQHQKGTTNFGADADLILLDDNLNVQATLIAGIPVWIKKGGFACRLLKSKFGLTNDIYG
ncbi:N-acetylglucosamine-6-phosphate deacetylase [Exaiptasia diaphana]|uniref:N-acetylglucosamine-6-phosphate deacetylase n=1 Tax=Exaiptasia diaphana TaxID=2652724 RepID=A0A913YZ54_EXADI|nr:N-acetylglucosamine-6-phosphate deacetylase [Exaiptasia diaphana]XP_028519727.1 N-acetylglucosamine-6-phosphate deacetylase [Exaiptasia diaphana]